ncbi:RNA 2',3'-cyclic phosphodiesterase [Pandoraea apista]|uniref:RNA 2',3'-cyclic phosphodiesterase n=1 Tax=Pandoraea apista TaxID=93218 RepID=A0ABX9ZS92_9BURK|nr:RNA 2',3'-cyclic phosphodiesterase [Pandoraea apista]PTE02263.1 RNA 2',3'-cyclic phosphodiesterase [Pandoraea apista]RRJ34650.1 RNA 2',3'-cyclic phosphodiesterase [Pandoraea apista]RRJ80776.1 RNA 2',3'-cyclic phosphodiesterase [Pandoraea apista]RSD17409.1 RNA 2',3'-cyclic phosphodiesterase [Pandoraea apista]RSD17533.1 RNA 2',3'-cyclic phosphodiesterase [Pandoraea apista]
MRLFLALWPGPGVREQLHTWAVSAHAECGGRVLRAQTLHLTLAFLDEVDPARLPVLLALMQRTPLTPFVLSFDHLGYWSDRKIVWAGAPSVPESLVAMRDTLLSQWRATGARVITQSFRPHVTLLRHARRAPSDPHPRPLVWHCDSYVLVHSVRTPRGPHYRVLAEYHGGLSEGVFSTSTEKSAIATTQYGIVG